jgi:GR25 family glycosyltransferase involved in LPS biosynthesis
MKVFVISHLQKIRSKELVSYLADLAVPFERIEDENDVTGRFRKGNSEVTRDLLYRSMTPTEYSCAFAHLSAILNFYESNSSCALIVEDDVIPILDFSSYVTLIQESKKATIYQLHTDINPTFTSMKWLRLLQPIDGAYAYLINREAARIILQTNQKTGVLVPADWHFPPMQSLRIYTSTIACFAHPDNRDESYIQPERGLMVAQKAKTASKFKRRVGFEDFSRSRSLRIPLRYYFGFRLRTYLQEIWIKRFFSINKAYRKY